jgi:hypothetical protein
MRNEGVTGAKEKELGFGRVCIRYVGTQILHHMALVHYAFGVQYQVGAFGISFFSTPKHFLFFPKSTYKRKIS